MITIITNSFTMILDQVVAQNTFNDLIGFSNEFKLRIIMQLTVNKIIRIISIIMSTTLNEYYSVSSKGYTKHPNIEVLGVEPFLPRATQSVLSVQRDFQKESVIQQQQNQYQPLEPKQQRPKLPSSLTARMMEREEVASIHLTPKCNTASLTSSCINQTQAVPHRGILKRSLMELQKKNITSQQDTNNDKQLYIELEKERRLRRELQKHYKQLLSEMHRKERSYSVDFGQKEKEKERKRQFSKRTLNYDKSSEGPMSVEDLETQKDSKINKTVKTVKLNLPQANKVELQREQHQNEEQQNDEEPQSPLSSRKSTLTQQSADEQAEYFREQREFQDGVISQLQHLNKRIEQIDHFLLEKEHEQKMEKLERTIEEKQRKIYKIQQENQRLRGIQKGQEKSEQSEYSGIQKTIMKNVTPTSLYFFLILVMAIVAMS